MRELRHSYLPEAITLNTQRWGENEEIWVAKFCKGSGYDEIQFTATGDTVMEAIRNVLTRMVAAEILTLFQAEQILWDS